MNLHSHSASLPDPFVRAFRADEEEGGVSSSQLDIATNSLTDADAGTPGEGYLILRDLIIPLSRSRQVLLGRDGSACNVVLADPRISKRHAVIYYSIDRFFVRDLESVNGTFVNRLRLTDKPEALVVGDRLLLRPYRMLFVGPEHPRVAHRLRPVDEEAAPEPKRAGHFSGKLEILRITDLIQLLNSTNQNGMLTVRDAQHHVAELSFQNGEIRRARYQSWQGEKAVHAVLARATRGEFEFVQGQPPHCDNPIAKPTLTLLLDGCRLLDEGNA